MGAKKPQYIKSIEIWEIANNWPLGAVPFSIVRLFCSFIFLFVDNESQYQQRCNFLSNIYRSNKNSLRCFKSKFDENRFGLHHYCLFRWFGLVNPRRANRIDPHGLMYPERPTFRFFLKVRTGGIEEYLVKF